VDIIKSYTRMLTLLGLAIFAAIAAWQFYLFATFKASDGVLGVQGGEVHLWVAIAIALIIGVAGLFLVSSFRRYDRRNEMHITSQGTPLA
jgi:hypothetical protein